MEPVPYLSPEWMEEARRRLAAELSPEKMNHVTASMETIYLNCPDGKGRAVHYRFEGGRLGGLSLSETPAGAEFSITGDYETLARISRAELNARSALMSGKLRLRGNMVRALTLAPLVDRLNKVLATIPTIY